MKNYYDSNFASSQELDDFNLNFRSQQSFHSDPLNHSQSQKSQSLNDSQLNSNNFLLNNKFESVLSNQNKSKIIDPLKAQNILQKSKKYYGNLSESSQQSRIDFNDILKLDGLQNGRNYLRTKQVEKFKNSLDQEYYQNKSMKQQRHNTEEQIKQISDKKSQNIQFDSSPHNKSTDLKDRNILDNLSFDDSQDFFHQSPLVNKTKDYDRFKLLMPLQPIQNFSIQQTTNDFDNSSPIQQNNLIDYSRIQNTKQSKKQSQFKIEQMTPYFQNSNDDSESEFNDQQQNMNQQQKQQQEDSSLEEEKSTKNYQNTSNKKVQIELTQDQIQSIFLQQNLLIIITNFMFQLNEINIFKQVEHNKSNNTNFNQLSERRKIPIFSQEKDSIPNVSESFNELRDDISNKKSTPNQELFIDLDQLKLKFDFDKDFKSAKLFSQHILDIDNSKETEGFQLINQQNLHNSSKKRKFDEIKNIESGKLDAKRNQESDNISERFGQLEIRKKSCSNDQAQCNDSNSQQQSYPKNSSKKISSEAAIDKVYSQQYSCKNDPKRRKFNES